MRKSLIHLVFNLVAASLSALVILPAVACRPSTAPQGPGGPAGAAPAPAEQGPPAELTIHYPPDEALFPPEIAPPVFRWEDRPSGADAWRLALAFQDGGDRLRFESAATEWAPSDETWEEIKRRSVAEPAEVSIEGFRRADPQTTLSQAAISIGTSEDEVGAPLFFREVNLPFLTAVKDPAAHIRWRFGSVSCKGPPPIVLEKLPVCGNCHSFSADGDVLAMEVDSGNDKGSYAIMPVEEEITLDASKIITWSDYKREDGKRTFGLLCQASPDGRYVVGTVKDRALAVYRPELAFSQLFFLVKGIMAIYDRQTGSFNALPGADDPDYVQTNATWSPDGKSIVFARSNCKAYDPPQLRDVETVLVPPKLARPFVDGERKFMFDLYRIPFNDGKGGKAEPIEGASHNGMSNYFPKFSPDGKWIVFCKARSFMLLQPDSELYIIPAAGGEPRRLRANTNRMNSWHSWSPNGKWLVFSSKAYSVYTQLFLTHIDEAGRSTPPVVLANFTEENRAANIPEFVNTTPGAIKNIQVRFLDDTNYLRAGDAFRKEGDFAGAVRAYRKALEINPDNAAVHVNMGVSLMQQGELDEARTHLLRATELEPDLATAHCSLGIVLGRQNRLEEAAESLREALKADREYAPAHLHLGALLLGMGRSEEATRHLSEAVRLDPDDPYARFNLAVALSGTGQPAQAAAELERTLEEDADFLPALVSLALVRATSRDDSLRDGRKAIELAARACSLTENRHPEALHALAAAYAETGRFEEAIATAETAVRIARSGGNQRMATALEEPIELYRRGEALRVKGR